MKKIKCSALNLVPLRIFEELCFLPRPHGSGAVGAMGSGHPLRPQSQRRAELSSFSPLPAPFSFLP